MRVPAGDASCEEAPRPAKEEIAFESDGQKVTDERDATCERRSGARSEETKQGGGGRLESAAGGGSEKSVAGEHLGWNGRGANASGKAWEESDPRVPEEPRFPTPVTTSPLTKVQATTPPREPRRRGRNDARLKPGQLARSQSTLDNVSDEREQNWGGQDRLKPVGGDPKTFDVRTPTL